MHAKTSWVAVAVAVAGLAIPASAGAAVTIGSDLTATPGGVNLCVLPTDPAATCTRLQAVLPGRQVTAPFDGVIVRWRLKQTNGDDEEEDYGPMRLMVASQQSGTSFSGVRSGAIEDPPAVIGGTEVTHVFNARLPIAAGQYIGVDLLGGCCIEVAFLGGSGASFIFWSPPALGDGETRSGGSDPGGELLYNADLEPDADADGFGDETQDQCPAQAGPNNGCPDPVPVDSSPPNASITKGPKDKTKKKTATFEFTANEPGATFECSLDSGPFAACSSPDTVKVKKGKHTFAVQATDQAGNTDGSPATFDWKVKKKKKR